MKHKYSKDFFSPNVDIIQKAWFVSGGLGSPPQPCLSSGSFLLSLLQGPSAHQSRCKRYCFCETVPDGFLPVPCLFHHMSCILLWGCIRTIFQWMKCGPILSDTSHCVTYRHIAWTYFPCFSSFGPWSPGAWKGLDCLGNLGAQGTLVCLDHQTCLEYRTEPSVGRGPGVWWRVIMQEWASWEAGDQGPCISFSLHSSRPGGREDRLQLGLAHR